MSVTEILDEISKLPAEKRHLVAERLHAMEIAEIEESPELLAAIDEGIRSLDRGEGIPFEKVRAEWEAKWPTR